MSEHIELRTFSANKDNDGDIEEYHEISQENVHDTTLFSNYSSPIKEFDFFTQFDVKHQKHAQRKRKKSSNGKTIKGPSLLDIISTELASVSVPVTENIVTTVDSEEHDRNYSYLIRTQSVQDLFRKSRPLRQDAEHG